MAINSYIMLIRSEHIGDGETKHFFRENMKKIRQRQGPDNHERVSVTE